jgi:hypothetical protein
MSKERAGDQVFANADEALAKRIISRSRKNSGEAAPAFGDIGRSVGYNAPATDDRGADGYNVNGYNDGFSPRFCTGLIPALKAGAALLALLVFVMLILGRRNRRG